MSRRRIAVTAVCLLALLTAAPPTASRSEHITIRLADTAQPRPMGGIIALYPRAADAQTLAIPGGQPPADLHVTLVYFGGDLTGPAETELVRKLAGFSTPDAHPVSADVFGHAVFNPSPDESDTALVYVVGDSPQLVPLRLQALGLSKPLVQLPAQPDPWVPHITAAYGPSDTVLTYTGSVVFDRIGLSVGDRTTYFPLGPPTTG